MNYMECIYKDLEKCVTTSKIHKFLVFVEGDIKEIYEGHYLVACINMKKKTFYTKYKLMGEVLLFSRYLKGLGYCPVEHTEELQQDAFGRIIGNFPFKRHKVTNLFNI
ncbi:hypothetical protein [Alkaliphilus hydrothermalis]|uniref:Uncharacterized protein n=1 Tax=Alkaliphilus hydrothermalis TaxID=1482730 RepID=A0ABS2NTK9_9FIRM|nr:hypothetical protein [Alkaliphilus hydrothermalis]MBM7616293.1 hypothetical protein [Alkaliphilus hydrothermalis]